MDGADGATEGAVTYTYDEDVPLLLYAAPFKDVPFLDLAVNL